MKMKLILGLAAFVCLFSACSSNDDNIGNWIEESSLDGIPRDGSISFTINNIGYVGLGVNTTADEEDDDFNSGTFGEYITEDGVFKDLWQFNGASWTQRATFPGEARRNAVAFTAGGKGFVGTGQTYTPATGWDEVKDFYSYNPNGNVWTQIDDFPGGNRYNMVGFGIEDKGYVGCGLNSNTFKDFYQIDASGETPVWTNFGTSDDNIYSFGFKGDKREGAQAFVINGFGYVISGRNNGVDLYDVWKFNPADINADLGPWTKQIDLDDSDFDFENVRRSYGVAWSTNGRGYVATGTRNGSSLSDVWEFNPDNQEWEEKQAFEGRPRRKGAAFVINGTAFVGLGATSNSNAYDDFWRFDPFAEYDSAD